MDERHVLSGLRKHWTALLLQILVIVSVAAPCLVGAVLIVFFTGLSDALGTGVVIGVCVAVAYLTLVTSLSWWSTSLTLTTHRILLRDGFVVRCTTAIPLSTITELAVQRRGFGLIFSYGTVTLTCAGSTGKTELTFVRHPERLERRLTQLVADSRDAVL